MPRIILLLLALLAPLASAHAQDRTVTEADGSRTLIVETWVPAKPDAVWPVISTAEGWTRWAVPHAWLTGDVLETSYKPGAAQGDPSNIQQRIVAALPGRLLVFRTIRTPPGFPHAETYMGVTSFFELIPDGEGTRIRLTSANYPATPAGTELLGFLQLGNRRTLDTLAARIGLTPLDFLAGHCWKGTLPNGDDNTHCFTRDGTTILDRHEVLRAGKKVYGGDTIYSWDSEARIVRFAYAGMGGTDGKGTMRLDGEELDFGSNDYAGKDGPITIKTRWVRIAPNAFEGRDISPTNAKFNRTTRYTRVD